MNSGFNGTGISFIFYVCLALLMLPVNITRLLNKKATHNKIFVAKHFLYGIVIGIVVWKGFSYLSSLTGLRRSGTFYGMLQDTALIAKSLLLTWVFLPIIFVAARRIIRRGHKKNAD